MPRSGPLLGTPVTREVTPLPPSHQRRKKQNNFQQQGPSEQDGDTQQSKSSKSPLLVLLALPAGTPASVYKARLKEASAETNRQH